MRLYPLALLSALLLPFLAVATVFAHAEPAIVAPGSEAVLTEPPTQVEIEMSQEMARREGANDIDVFNEAGEEVTSVAAVIDNANRRKLSVPLPSGLAPGVYTVRWKTLSAEDGDPARGEYTFTVDPEAAPEAGQVNLRENLPTVPAEEPEEQPAPVQNVDVGGGGDGTSWVLVTAVAVGCLVLGSGTTYLLVQKKE
ncbi:MAG: copper resistance protein CopC [Dehalococcoidia bacterium]|nr:copper resistance protein CopC [Dehalococcoidia bacterium]